MRGALFIRDLYQTMLPCRAYIRIPSCRNLRAALVPRGGTHLPMFSSAVATWSCHNWDVLSDGYDMFRTTGVFQYFDDSFSLLHGLSVSSELM